MALWFSSRKDEQADSKGRTSDRESRGRPDSLLSALRIAPGAWKEAWEAFARRRTKEKQDLNVYRVLREGARPTAEYYVLIVLSCMIATLGLIQGSTAVIIGAMIIAPLMTPILAFSLGVIWGDTQLLKTSFSSVVKGAILAVGISSALAYAVPILHFSTEVTARANPSPFDIMVALGSGALAAYGYANKKVSSALTGIAIAVALMPPLCTVGIGLGKLNMRIATGAAVLFGVNLVSISLAGAAVFWLMRIHPYSEDAAEVKRRALNSNHPFHDPAMPDCYADRSVCPQRFRARNGPKRRAGVHHAGSSRRLGALRGDTNGKRRERSLTHRCRGRSGHAGRGSEAREGDRLRECRPGSRRDHLPWGGKGVRAMTERSAV